jgi:hypothetical protein
MPKKTKSEEPEKAQKSTKASSSAARVETAAAKPEAVEPVVAAAAKKPETAKPSAALAPNQPASDETRPNRAPNHEEIARRAYELWVKRHGMGGTAQEDWLRAEQELRGSRR